MGGDKRSRVVESSGIFFLEDTLFSIMVGLLCSTSIHFFF